MGNWAFEVGVVSPLCILMLTCIQRPCFALIRICSGGAHASSAGWSRSPLLEGPVWLQQAALGVRFPSVFSLRSFWLYVFFFFKMGLQRCVQEVKCWNADAPHRDRSPKVQHPGTAGSHSHGSPRSLISQPSCSSLFHVPRLAFLVTARTWRAKAVPKVCKFISAHVRPLSVM